MNIELSKDFNDYVPFFVYHELSFIKYYIKIDPIDFIYTNIPFYTYYRL